MSGASTNEVTIATALIGLVGTIGAALITVRARPRQTPVAQQAASQGAPAQQGGMAADGTYRLVQPGLGQDGGQAPGAQPGPLAGRLKISRSLWWGIAAVVCYAVFALSWACALVGVFLAVRDIRSPGTRRLAWWGMSLCVLGLVIAAANPHSGFMAGFHQGYNQSSH